MRLLTEVINKFYRDLRRKEKDVLLIQVFRDGLGETCYKLPHEKNPIIT